MLYFAYGSNLDDPDRRARTTPDPLTRVVGPAWLPDHALAFGYASMSRGGGVLDVRPHVGSLVPGVLYEIRNGGLKTLDHKEGHPSCYRRRNVVVLTEDGGMMEALTYEVVAERRRPFVPPTEDYLQVVRRGYRTHGLPQEILEAAARGEPAGWHLHGLFAYGTLMRGEGLHHHVRDILSCALLASAPGRIVDLGAFPGWVPPHGPEDRVSGEFFLLENAEEAIRRLDRVEGCRGYGSADALYVRRLVRVDVGEGRLRPAWTYVLVAQRSDATPIPGGDSRRWRVLGQGL